MKRGLELSVEDAVARVRERNSRVRAVLYPTLARALEAARALDRSSTRAPLHRVPYVLKDTWDVAGIPTTAGSYRFRNRVPSESCSLAKALEQTGAVLIGKSNLCDLGMTPESDNCLFGPVCNPHDLERTSGGSTGGGAAAVADGMAAFDWGSDFGGSIRLPSAFCGVVGLRLSGAVYPPYGHFPNASELGLTGIGPITASVADAVRVLSAVDSALRAPSFPRSFDVNGVSIVRPDTFSIGSWPSFERDAKKLFSKLDVDAQSAPLPPPREIDRAFAWYIAANLGRVFEGRAFSTAVAAIGGLAFGWLDAPWMHRQTAAVLAKLAIAKLTVYRGRDEAERRMADVRGAVNAIFDRRRLLVCPTTAFPAPRHGKAVFAQGIGAFVKLGNVVDATAIAVPFGRFACGLPRSIQIIGPPGSEEAVLALAARVEAVSQPSPSVDRASETRA